MQGISLLAIGNPTYGTWASNMAHSLRHFHADAKIQLVYEKATVKDIDTGIFDVLTEIEPEDARRNGKLSPSYAKLRMVEYYPAEWEKVMFLDVDALAIAPFMDLFDRLDSDFKIHTWGVTEQADGIFGNMLWMEIGKMREVFGIPTEPIPGTNSSFQIMKLNDATKKIYRDAQEAYYLFESDYGSRALHMQWGKRRTVNSILPDELFFNVALSKTSGYDGWKPILFHTNKDGHLDLDEHIKAGKKFIGFWGDKGYNSPMSRSTYDLLVKRYTGQRSKVVDKLLKDKFVNYN